MVGARSPHSAKDSTPHANRHPGTTPKLAVRCPPPPPRDTTRPSNPKGFREAAGGRPTTSGSGTDEDQGRHGWSIERSPKAWRAAPRLPSEDVRTAPSPRAKTTPRLAPTTSGGCGPPPHGWPRHGPPPSPKPRHPLHGNPPPILPRTCQAPNPTATAWRKPMGCPPLRDRVARGRRERATSTHEAQRPLNPDSTATTAQASKGFRTTPTTCASKSSTSWGQHSALSKARIGPISLPMGKG